jgi:hypothetical protein
MNTHPFLSALRTDPDLLLQNFDFRERCGLIVKINEAAYRQTAFLDERVFSSDTQGAWFPLPALLRSTADLSITHFPHYIFHIGHCGSTLISRLLGELPHTFSLREPVILLAMAMTQRELDLQDARLSRNEWQQLLDMSLKLLTRTYRADDRPLIKLTSAAGNLLGALLDASKDSNALLLFVDLPTYLATMLRVESTRENLRAYAGAWRADFCRITGDSAIDKAPLDDVHQAVISWLAMISTFIQGTAQHPGRTLWLNFEDLLDAPAKHLQAAGDLFGVQAHAETINAIVNGPLMNRYAKDPQQIFDRHRRQQELAQAHTKLKKEIRVALDWAESLCKDIPVLEPVVPYLRFNRAS